MRNQFRSLDEDEVEFLDSIAAEERAKEAAVRLDAKARLEAFKAQQQEAEKAVIQSPEAEPAATETWTSAGRKRKKQDALAGIVKKRQLSSTTGESNKPVAVHTSTETAATSLADTVSTKAALPDKKPLLGLADYSSDDE